MAIATTSLSSAVAIADKFIVVASATSFAAGRIVRIDGELMKVADDYVSGTTIPVLKGQGGTQVVAHPASAEVVHGLATDFGDPAAQTSAQFSFHAPTIIKTYSASGEIALPAAGSNGIAVLNAASTTVLTMTLPVPTADMNGTRLTLLSQNGTGAHIIYIGAVAGATSGTGLNGAGTSYDKFTFPAGPVALDLFVWNEAWYTTTHPAFTGTVTLLVGGIA